MSGLLSQVGSKYREGLKKNLCIFGKSLGNNGGKKGTSAKTAQVQYLCLCGSTSVKNARVG